MNKESGEKMFLGGAIVAAIAASLCCILPVLAVAFGLGAFGMATIFESLRPYLLVVVVLALAFGFYQTYFRREKCGEGKACSTKPICRFNQIILWMATIGIAVFAFFHITPVTLSRLWTNRSPHWKQIKLPTRKMSSTQMRLKLRLPNLKIKREKPSSSRLTE